MAERPNVMKFRMKGSSIRPIPNLFVQLDFLPLPQPFLASGGTLEEIGKPAEMRDLRWGEPSYAGNCLRGKVIHIDKFGNAITNIEKDGFLNIKKGRRFEYSFAMFDSSA